MHRGEEASAILNADTYTLQEKFSYLPRVLPFLLLLTGVMVALYGGLATPSETAGLDQVPVVTVPSR